ncbi:hypothetical protein J7J13_00970 [bacterium]|nr:hypothetical protein [bacterium]
MKFLFVIAITFCHSRLDRESRMQSLALEITLDSRLRGNDIVKITG